MGTPSPSSDEGPEGSVPLSRASQSPAVPLMALTLGVWPLPNNVPTEVGLVPSRVLGSKAGAGLTGSEEGVGAIQVATAFSRNPRGVTGAAPGPWGWDRPQIFGGHHGEEAQSSRTPFSVRVLRRMEGRWPDAAMRSQEESQHPRPSRAERRHLPHPRQGVQRSRWGQLEQGWGGRGQQTLSSGGGPTGGSDGPCLAQRSRGGLGPGLGGQWRWVGADLWGARGRCPGPVSLSWALMEPGSGHGCGSAGLRADRGCRAVRVRVCECGSGPQGKCSEPSPSPPRWRGRDQPTCSPHPSAKFKRRGFPKG